MQLSYQQTWTRSTFGKDPKEEQQICNLIFFNKDQTDESLIWHDMSVKFLFYFKAAMKQKQLTATATHDNVHNQVSSISSTGIRNVNFSLQNLRPIFSGKGTEIMLQYKSYKLSKNSSVAWQGVLQQNPQHSFSDSIHSHSNTI